MQTSNCRGYCRTMSSPEPSLLAVKSTFLCKRDNPQAEAQRLFVSRGVTPTIDLS
jgi:hypothetical protein